MYNLHCLKVTNGIFQNYTYIIVDKLTRFAACVDPAWDLSYISDKLLELNAELKLVLLTHSHHDHTNLVSSITEKYNPQVYMNVLEIKDYGYKCQNLIGFRDNEIIKLGNTAIQTIWTPGHTSGSSCFLLNYDILTGDTLFTEGVGVCIPELGGCPDSFFNSIQHIKNILSENINIYPGHSFGEKPGHPFKSLFGKNIYLHINDKEHFKNFRMRVNQEVSLGI
ncbi:MAG: MBL fold metallo-hydrolase [Desulfobacterales bacterium]|nr:MBL fold metallo-hydrolase [Desulfobacterales bacterium]